MNTHTFPGQVSFLMDIAWTDHSDSHRDHFYINQMNNWRDLDTNSFLCRAMDNAEKKNSTLQAGPGELVPPYDPAKKITLPKSRLNPGTAFESLIPGRFYPQGMITGLPGVFKGNTTPFRCLEKNSRTLLADLNHPLARFPLDITLGDITWQPPARAERGGSCTDWLPLALSGPGLQAGFSQWPDCFLIPHAFDRQDRNPDTIFYEQDRFVHHIDSQARQVLSGWYHTLLPYGGRILDLMAGWTSHL
ncbi:MAG: hypothetical protein ABR534_15035, partial [Desulfotignum sp.]